jgi:hypothetical protein
MAILNRLRGQLDRAGAVVLTVAGAVLLFLGWFGASGTGLTAKQIPYVISDGLGGIFLMGLGAALWLSADLRDEWVKLDRIEHVLSNGLEGLGLGRDRDGWVTIAPLPAERDGASPAATGQVERSAEKELEFGVAVSNGRHVSRAYSAGGSSES